MTPVMHLALIKLIPLRHLDRLVPLQFLWFHPPQADDVYLTQKPLSHTRPPLADGV